MHTYLNLCLTQQEILQSESLSEPTICTLIWTLVWTSMCSYLSTTDHVYRCPLTNVGCQNLQFQGSLPEMWCTWGQRHIVSAQTHKLIRKSCKRLTDFPISCTPPHRSTSTTLRQLKQNLTLTMMVFPKTQAQGSNDFCSNIPITKYWKVSSSHLQAYF